MKSSSKILVDDDDMLPDAFVQDDIKSYLEIAGSIPDFVSVELNDMT